MWDFYHVEDEDGEEYACLARDEQEAIEICFSEEARHRDFLRQHMMELLPLWSAEKASYEDVSDLLIEPKALALYKQEQLGKAEKALQGIWEAATVEEKNALKKSFKEFFTEGAFFAKVIHIFSLSSADTYKKLSSWEALKKVVSDYIERI